MLFEMLWAEVTRGLLARWLRRRNPWVTTVNWSNLKGFSVRNDHNILK